MKNPNLRILVIDDEPMVCQFFVDLYSEMGISVDTELDGDGGLTAAESNKYDLIFLDIKLKDVNGIDILRQLKELDKDLKIVIISGYFTDESLQAAKDLGAEGFLHKPLSVRDIMAKTYQLLKLQEMNITFF